MKLGENMTLRRMARFETAGKLSVYLHGTKIGVMVDMQGGDEQLGKDLAMHIAASKPICVSKEQVSSELLAKEREIYTAQAAESGKPANIVEKMVDGRVLKYLAEITLLGQPFVKNPDETVEKLLASKNARVNTFQMFIVGEGIEKKVVDFAAEVAAAGQI
jgi:elongation factor Ts